MSTFTAIRQRLGMTQKDLAQALGLSQGNVSLYEVKNQTVPPRVAKKLIEFARTRDVELTYDEVYAEPPREKRRPAPKRKLKAA